MGVTAENLAKKHGITREQCDEFAVRSQVQWGKAKEAGVFDGEMAPIEVKTRKGMVTIDADEHPKPGTTVEQISKLRPVFDKEGVVTAAGASGICDGAGTIILASEEAVKEVRWRALRRAKRQEKRAKVQSSPLTSSTIIPHPHFAIRFATLIAALAQAPVQTHRLELCRV